MRVKNVIGLLGQAGSGKTTAAEFMVKEYGAKQLSVAYAVKMMTQQIYDLSDEQVWGNALAKETVDPRHGKSPRKLMQEVCDAGREHIFPDVWAHRAMEKMYATDADLIVFDSVRFAEDARAINSLDIMSRGPASGYVIKLVCEDSISDEDGTAASEASVNLVPDKYITTTIVSRRTPDSWHLKKMLTEALRELNVI